MSAIKQAYEEEINRLWENKEDFDYQYFTWLNQEAMKMEYEASLFDHSLEGK